MSAVIKPTVGRVVLFHQTTAGVFPGSDKARAAIVAEVHSDTLVNLTVFDANGGTLARTSVPLVQAGEEPPVTMYCCWMPYQVGQAAKAEELQKQLNTK